jgi:hypothetical protein
MHILRIIFLLLISLPIASAETYHIDRYVISSGGGQAESDNYQINATIGQPIVGVTSSSSYIVESGYWVGAGAPVGLKYLPADVNMYNGVWPPAVVGADVTYLVNFFRGSLASHQCLLNGFWCSADVNGDCQVIGGDVTRLVSWLRGQNVQIEYCPAYEPAWHDPSELPAEAPVGWPGCETPVSANNFTAEDQGKE